MDVEGKVNVWNQHASRVVGFTAEQTVGRPFVEEFITEDFRASVQEVLNKALRGDETANFQLPLVTAHGKRVDILLNATSRKDAEGQIIGVVGIGQVNLSACSSIGKQVLVVLIGKWCMLFLKQPGHYGTHSSRAGVCETHRYGECAHLRRR